MKRKKRVLVGMSGGVDSSVTAAILKKRGYDVIGITMQLLPKEEEKKSACCNLDAISDAKRVASLLNIPHYTINIRDTFRHHVIDYFVNEYLLGKTPNPCVECNRYIKFDELQRKAIELNADYVATGHYCKITANPQRSRFFLKKSEDLKKDQTYFLYMLTSEQLSKTLFPLGQYKKTEIRAMAESLKLVNAQKKESQDICFVTKGSYAQFIKAQCESIEPEPGPIIDMNGTYLGEHKGLYHYTIGQRRGLNISSSSPLYVIKINAKDNTLIVGHKDELASTTITIKNMSLVNKDECILGNVFDTKMRYQMTPFKSKVTHLDKDTVTLTSSTPLQYITPGQSCVLYEKDRVVGGGIIS